jgi:actin-like ATPase involved in cell morphogenesis
VAQERVTPKASMGRQPMRAAPGVARDAFKPGGKALVTIGQGRKDSVITRIELVKP